MTLMSRPWRRRSGLALPGLSLLAIVAMLGMGLAAEANAAPLGRAYELVSPADDPNGTPAGVATDSNPMPAIAAVDGNRIVYGAPAAIGTTVNGPPNPFIFGERTATGWTAETAIRTTDNGETALDFSTSEPNSAWVSPNADWITFDISRTLGPPNTLPGIAHALYRQQAGMQNTPEWLTAPGPGGTAGPGASRFFHTSRDGRTVVFSSGDSLTADGLGGVYAIRDGQLELISRDADNLPITGASLANTSIVTTASGAIVYRNAVSRDGRFVHFTGPAVLSKVPLYVRDLEQGVTRELVATADVSSFFAAWPPMTSNQNVSTVPNGVVFAAPDAPVAYFRSAANLAPGASGTADNKIYRADLATGAISYVAPIQGPPVAVSADGSQVLFLHPTGGTSSDPWELRHWEEGGTTSTLLGSIPGSSASTGMVRSFRSSEDGGVWVFTAAGSLDPERPNLSPGANNLQVYRWQVGTANPICLSCQPTDGITRFRGANMSVNETHTTETTRNANGTSSSVRDDQMAQVTQAISSDARVIAFDSPDRLVPEDQNEVRDVYLWDANAAPGDRLQLLTSGRGYSASYYLDMSKDGSDIFFATRDGLVEEDRDQAFDIYDARVGGGFPGQASSCVSEACRPVIAAPNGVAVGSDRVDGNGNVSPAVSERRAAIRVRRLAARTGTAAMLRVQVSGPGRVVARGHGVRRVAKRTTRAGNYRLRLVLNRGAKRKLAKKGRFRTKVGVRFRSSSGSASSRTVVVAFGTPVRKAGR